MLRYWTIFVQMIPAIQQFITAYMGHQYIEPPTFDLPLSYKESTYFTPLIFVLSSGADPMAVLFKFAEEKGIQNHIFIEIIYNYESICCIIEYKFGYQLVWWRLGFKFHVGRKMLWSDAYVPLVNSATKSVHCMYVGNEVLRETADHLPSFANVQQWSCKNFISSATSQVGR